LASYVVDLPERVSISPVEHDPEVAPLLYVGPEFGSFFSRNGGQRWAKLSGVPTVAIRDLEVHTRDGDLVLSSFGRGFFVLDDVQPLREATAEVLGADAASFSVRDALAYQETMMLGLPGKSFQGDSYYLAPNPPFGAVFTYRLKESFKTRREQRHESEEEATKAGETVAIPSFDDLRLEAEEKAPTVILTVRGQDGEVVRRLTGPASKGFHRVAWDLRRPSPQPVRLEPHQRGNPWDNPPIGPPVVPGSYTVSFESVVRGERQSLVKDQTSEVVPLGAATPAAAARAALDPSPPPVALLPGSLDWAPRALPVATCPVLPRARAPLAPCRTPL